MPQLFRCTVPWRRLPIGRPSSLWLQQQQQGATVVNPMTAAGRSTTAVLKRTRPVAKAEQPVSLPGTEYVTFIPILHAASQAFYDNVLKRVQKIVQQTASPTLNSDNNKGSNAGAPVLRCRILVEGVAEDERVRMLQHDEWLQVAGSPEAAAELVAFATRYSRAAPLLEQGGSGLQHAFQRTNRESEENPPEENTDDGTGSPGGSADSDADRLRSIVPEICDQYRVPFPLPRGILLEDLYFKQLLAAAYPLLLFNSDVTDAELRQQVLPPGQGGTGQVPPEGHPLAQAVAQEKEKSQEEEALYLRHESTLFREERCAQVVLQTLSQLGWKNQNEDLVALLKKEKEFKEPEMQKPVDTHVIVLWGHYHAPRITALLKQRADFTEDVQQASAYEPLPYGWP